jgi:hypothetical protein
MWRVCQHALRWSSARAEPDTTYHEDFFDMDRRLFLKRLGVASIAVTSPGLLAACGGDDGPAGIPDTDPSLNVINASFETLTGTERRFAFGVASLDNVPVEDRGFQVFVRDLEGNVESGPFETTYHGDTGAALGVYLAHIDVPEAGPREIVAVDGDEWGSAVVNVVEPADSQVAVPGAEALAVATPTTDDEMGLERLCTQDPPCGMHEVSLDQALAAGRPVMLMFATPAYCQTAVCGPAVGTLDEVRESGDWDDVAFIHVEIFSDAGETVTDPVREWGLPTEPWVFAIGADGTVADRADGPMIDTELAGMAEQINGAA